MLLRFIKVKADLLPGLIFLFQLNIIPEIDTTQSVPFKNRFFYRPCQREAFDTRQRKMFDLYGAEKPVADLIHSLNGNFNINTYPAVATYNGGGKITTMGNGKLVLRIR